MKKWKMKTQKNCGTTVCFYSLSIQQSTYDEMMVMVVVVVVWWFAHIHARIRDTL